MKLNELVQLDEAIDLNLGQMRATYGSWMHPKLRAPIYAKDRMSHPRVANQIIAKTDPEFAQEWQAGTTEISTYAKMFEDGWVRLIHGQLVGMQFSGYKDSIAALLSLIPSVRNAVETINIDVEDCTSPKGCRTVFSETYDMPGQWNEMRRALQ